jgi:hypothetical protein
VPALIRLRLPEVRDVPDDAFPAGRQSDPLAVEEHRVLGVVGERRAHQIGVLLVHAEEEAAHHAGEHFETTHRDLSLAQARGGGSDMQARSPPSTSRCVPVT